MPSEQQASGRRHARYPEYLEKFGEDPARWLDWSLMGDRDRREMVRTRILSIDDIELARAWIEVETDLERGPRKKIIGWLNGRIQTLKVIGERPDRLTDRDGRDVPPKEWVRIEGEGDDREPVPWNEVDRSVGVSRAVATDGGESGVES